MDGDEYGYIRFFIFSIVFFIFLPVSLFLLVTKMIWLYPWEIPAALSHYSETKEWKKPN